MRQDVWHRETITETVAQVLRELEQSSVLSPFYLAGGTGLALQYGHCRSQDLDFFSRDLFDPDILLQKLHQQPGFSLTAAAPHTLHAVIQGVKVSFFGYAYPLLFPPKEFLGVQMGDPRDIACMKLSAIASRATKRDFVDLFLMTRRIDLIEIMHLFHRKFSEARYSSVHLLKSLTFFEDAEKDPDPDMLVPVSWLEVKQFFIREAARLP